MDLKKLVCLSLAAAAGAALVFRGLVGGVLGGSTEDVQLIVSGLVFYACVSAPRRVGQASSCSESREAVTISAAAATCLSASGSRAKTLLSLRSDEPGIAAALKAAGRSVLLGVPVRESVRTASAHLASYSAANAVCGVADQSPQTLDERGEESEGITSYAQLSHETKLPIFMTVCIFTPILLVMYSVISRVTTPDDLAELVALDVVVLEIAFNFCSADRA